MEIKDRTFTKAFIFMLKFYGYIGLGLAILIPIVEILASIGGWIPGIIVGIILFGSFFVPFFIFYRLAKYEYSFNLKLSIILVAIIYLTAWLIGQYLNFGVYWLLFKIGL